MVVHVMSLPSSQTMDSGAVGNRRSCLASKQIEKQANSLLFPLLNTENISGGGEGGEGGAGTLC